MRRSTLRRKSPLKPSKQGVKRSHPPKRKALPKINRKRKARASAKAYGPAERRTWMTGLPCCYCHRAPTDDYPSQQAHTGKKPGLGLKSGYETCVPMCAACHRLYDDYKPPFDWDVMRREIEAKAADYQRRWLATTQRQEAA